MIKSIFLIASTLLVVGCTSQIELLFEELPKEGWMQDQWVEFDYTNRLPKKQGSLYWVLRHDDDYPFSNIHLIATWRKPKGVGKTGTFSYLLAKPNGKWHFQITNRTTNSLQYWKAYSINEAKLFCNKQCVMMEFFTHTLHSVLRIKGSLCW